MTAYTPNLPALIPSILSSSKDALPGDATRAPQTEFTRARQVLFLENLSVTGSVRSAASAGGVSHQTAYRARRSQKPFRLAWDAALVAARVHAEGTLACRAIDGIEEKVFYHGEEVATRTRYSDRLLLAHLARLDRHAADERINAIAEDFDAALARFEAGEEVEVPAPERAPEPAAAPPENFSPGPCNTRSMSNTPDGGEWDEERDEDEDDGIDWEDEKAAEAELARIEAAMEADRPADAPRLTGVGPDGEDRDPHGVTADAQWRAFERRVPRWWQVVPPVPARGSDDWRYADPAMLAALAGEDTEDEAEVGEDGGACDAEAALAAEPVVERSGEPTPEALPEPPAAPAPEPPVRRAGGYWKAPPYMGTMIVDDGRLQPFHGRAYTG